MTDRDHSEPSAAESFPRRVPVIITFLRPFRLITESETDDWTATIDQINFGIWDYVKLHELVGGVDIGLPPPYHMALGFDGALALPPIPELRSIPESVTCFNKSLAAVLLGGIYCEAVTPDDLCFGSILDWKYIRIQKAGRSFPSQFHHAVRMRKLSPLHAIELLEPRRVSVSQIVKAASAGTEILSTTPELNPEFLLLGSTSFARCDWGAALSHLWIVVEQLTSHLWQREVLDRIASAEVEIRGRRDQLNDHRTWSASTKHELLLQKNVIDEKTLDFLFVARKARNDLLHRGKNPDEVAATAALEAVKSLLQVAALSSDIPFLKLDLKDHTLSDPFQPQDRGPIEPRYFMSIPKLPGEEELERSEASNRTADDLSE